MNTQIDITQNGTTTLATAGKYCDRNIDVNVNVDNPNIVGLVQGTIEGDFVNDAVTSLRYCAFYGCSKLTSISLPNCTTLNAGYNFSNCSQVTTLNLPNLTTLQTATRNFANMNNLQELNLPNLTSAGTMDSTFLNAERVKVINLPKLGGVTFSKEVFANCYCLRTLILGGDFISMSNTNVFRNTGSWISSSFSVYVPDNLVDTYKTATNWTAYADKIKPISELEG